MGHKIFKDDELLRMIDSEGLSQAAAAKALGVSRQAVFNRLKELRVLRTKELAASPVRLRRSIDHQIDAVDQLNEINARALNILDAVGDNPELSIRCLAELRQQLKLAGDLYSQLYSIQVVDQFMATLTEILKDVDENAFIEFQKRFNAQRALRSTVVCN